MSTLAADSVTKKSKDRVWFRIFLVGVAMSVMKRASGFVMQNWDVSLWLRVLLALSPLLPLFALWQLSRTEVKADELDLRINQEASIFAFYGLLVVLMVTDLLVKGRVLAGFTWQSEWLVVAALLLFGLGYAKSALRYR